MKKLVLFIFLLSLFSWFIWQPKKVQAVFVCDYITVDTPNGGETWAAGTTQNIQWTTDDNGMAWDSMNILYSTDSGNNFNDTIVSDTANDGQYEWSIPASIDSSTVRIRVVGNLPAFSFCDGLYDDSDDDFTISSPYKSIVDTISDSTINSDSLHTIEASSVNDEVTTDGSVKITFPSQFDMTALLASDTSISGGSVTWGTTVVDSGSNSIIFPFIGDLNDQDGKISIIIGDSNFISNPSVTGSYQMTFSVYASSDGSGIPVENRTFSVAITESILVTATIPSSLTFTIAGVTDSGTCPNSSATGEADIATTATSIPFGSMTVDTAKVGCQTLTVSTNASGGYVVTVQQNQDLTAASGRTIDAFKGTDGGTDTYTAPEVWAKPKDATPTTHKGYFGFTTDDTDAHSNLFASYQYAGFQAVDTPYEVARAAGSVSNEVDVVSYKLEVTNLQEAGIYSNTLMYICTATF